MLALSGRTTRPSEIVERRRTRPACNCSAAFLTAAVVLWLALSPLASYPCPFCTKASLCRSRCYPRPAPPKLVVASSGRLPQARIFLPLPSCWYPDSKSLLAPPDVGWCGHWQGPQEHPVVHGNHPKGGLHCSPPPPAPELRAAFPPVMFTPVLCTFSVTSDIYHAHGPPPPQEFARLEAEGRQASRKD